MKNLSISRRLVLAFGFTLALLFAVAVVGGLTNLKLAQSAADITGRRLGMFSATNDLTVSVLRSARHTRNMLILDDDKIAAEVAATRAQREARIPNFALMRNDVANPEGKNPGRRRHASRQQL